MEHHNGPNRPSANQAANFGEGHPDTELGHAHQSTHPLIGELPRMFALAQGFDEGDEEEESPTEVVAYGLALPGGATTTVGANGHGFGLWNSASSAARRLHSDLAWLGEDAVRPDGAGGSPS
ncbi:hypothetical protein AB0395_09095 [Streptosporangium sp. NPDC051023]|uniref:hypothetical protein n=1 Tax=Streptosporangium sp. NPDC051023 TaxID=3155410 RepID=UPI0034507782